MSLVIIAFLSWILSVLAPCVLPVLPVILGGSLGNQKRYRPLVIVLSTAVFITLFTVLLKVSTALIGIPQQVRTALSAIIIIAYGSTLIRPNLREYCAEKIWLHKVNTLATKAKEHTGLRWDILLWASLGPIFASCSPTYALLLSVVFPQSIFAGITYTLIYSLWFALFLLLLAYGGRAMIRKFSRAANPQGVFKKWLWVILILTWVLIISWYMKKLEVAILDAGFFDIGQVEQKLLEKLPTNSPSLTEIGLGQISSNTNQDTDNATTQNTNHPWAKLLNANYPAPDIVWLDNWINGGNYTSLQQLKGKVVIVDFWTYSCINCIRTLDALKSWHQKYADKWLVIVWVHAPEFQFEKDIKNVQKAVKEYGLDYPVVQDNNFQTRRNYNNRYWPAKYIIDTSWNVRYTHFGEWAYEETEQVIQYLLWEAAVGIQTDSKEAERANYVPMQTPETYLGTARRTNQYTDSKTDVMNARWTTWKRNADDEKITTTTAWSITINAYASEVNLVLWGWTEQDPLKAQVFVDGVLTKTLMIWSYTLYELYKNDVYGMHTVEVRFDTPWVEAYAYTFG